MKKIILCNSEAKDYVLTRLLEQSDNHSLEDTEIRSVSSFLNSFLKEKPTLEEIRETGRTLGEPELLPLLEDSGFLREIGMIREECERYDLDPDTFLLPSCITKLIRALPERGYAGLKESEIDPRELCIVKDHYSLFERRFLKSLKEKGVPEADLIRSYVHESFCYETENVADQYEAAVQKIVIEDLPLQECAFLLCDPAEKELCLAALRRYEVPCYSKDLLPANTAAADLTALLDFCFSPDLNNYGKVIERNLFAPADTAVYSYLQDHMKESELFAPLRRLQREEKYYRELEEKADAVHRQTWPELKKLCECRSYKEKIVKAFSYLKEGEDKEAVRYYLQERGPSLKEEHYGLLKEELLSLKTASKKNNGIFVSVLNKPCYGFRYLFVFDCCEKLFPGFKPKEGLLNEYTLKDTAYPPIGLREADHLQVLEYLRRSEKTFYYLSLSTADGKAQSLSLSLADISKETVRPVKCARSLPEQHSLRPETSRALFFDEDGVLNGSVSSFEKYNKCPYAYFLNYGLGLRSPSLYSFDPATVGTVLHAFFEGLIRDYGKDYGQVGEDTIEERLLPFRRRFEELYPHKKKETAHLFQNMKENLMLELSFLAKMESETVFVPKEQEYRFREMFVDNEDAKVRFRGSIDRLDECGKYVRVLDYKTSDHSLSESAIRAGISLQMLTYLFLYAGITGKEPLAAYYCNLNLKRQNEERFSYAKTKGFQEKIKDKEELFYRKQRLKGWSLDDPPGIYSTYESVPSRTSAYISKDYIYDKDKIYDALQQIYTSVYQSLSGGEIPLEPGEDACSCCDYGAVCRFKGREGYAVRSFFEGSLKKEEVKEK